MEFIIRQTSYEDFEATESIVRAAFWDLYKPGCDEHYLIHLLRQSAIYLPKLDFVAEANGEIIGNILHTDALIRKSVDTSFKVLSMALVAVNPNIQKKGVGKALMTKSISMAKALGYEAVVVFGDPVYYRQFGFEEAKKFHIITQEGENFDRFMVLDLKGEGLKHISGRFMLEDVFVMSKESVDAFDKKWQE